jgi:biotin carboxyl carrier protein
MKEFKYTINGNTYNVAVGEIKDSNVVVTVNGEEYTVEMERKTVAKERVKVQAPKPAAPVATKTNANDNNTINGEALKAPLPGVINEICVKVGDNVEVGQTVVILEAMKMANNLDTEKAGTVTAILVEPGQTVMENTPLVVIA